MNTYNEIWELVLSELSKKYSKGLIDIWFRKLELVHLDDKNAFIVTEDEGFVDLLNSKYASQISDALKEVMDLSVTTRIYSKKTFTVEGALTSIETGAEEEKEEPAPVQNPSLSNTGSFNIAPYVADSNYTFDNFVVGSSNKFAHAVSLAVANHPAEEYNPLFIYGASGLGKTHLMKAIVNKVKVNFPDFKIMFVKGDDFLNEMISAIANKTMPQFKEKYRKVDMLLVDDVQFIAGKISTQEEFFHTFNALFEDNKQIILTSDRPPKEIQHLEDRIKSRFEGGMIADIQPPDTELRIAIIKTKCETMNINLSNDVLTFIGENIKNNIRQIEGVIKKLGAYSYISNKPITIDIAKEQLAGFISLNTSPAEVAEKIIENVCNIYNVTPVDVKSKKRSKDIAFARHVSIYVIKNTTQLTLGNIGKIFDRDHTTIMSSLEVVKNEMDDNPETERIVSNLIKDFS